MSSGGGRGYNVARTPLQSPIDHWGKWDNFRDFRKFVEGKRRRLTISIVLACRNFGIGISRFVPFQIPLLLPKVPSLPLDGTGFVNDPSNTIRPTRIIVTSG